MTLTHERPDKKAGNTGSKKPNQVITSAKIDKVIETGIGLVGLSFLLFIPVTVIILVFRVTAGIALGIDLSKPTDARQDAQLIMWVTTGSFLLFYGTYRLLKRLNKGSLLRLLIIIALPFLAVGGGVGTIAEYSSAQREAAAACDISSTLDKALSATYPIGTNTGYGTAFAVDPDGTLLTAYHVVDGASSIYLDLASGHAPLSVIKTDPTHDLALLKYSQPTPSFLPLVIVFKVGDPVYAVGYPGNTFTAGQSSVSAGIVSRTLSPADVHLNYDTAPTDLSYVQTDAAINPGNSGGPLISRCGAIGVVDAVSDSEDLHRYNLPVSEQNISYAISAQTVRSVLGF